MKNTKHKRTQWSQSIIDSGQNQLKYSYQLQQSDTTHHAKHTTTHRKVTLKLNNPSLQNKTTDAVIHQHSRKLLKMDILTLTLLTWRIGWASNNASKGQMGFNLAFKGLMSETCWAHKKWNKIASDIKLVFHSSTIAMMHGPINIRFTTALSNVSSVFQLFPFLVVCSSMISKGFSFVAFFAGVETSSVCIHL